MTNTCRPAAAWFVRAAAVSRISFTVTYSLRKNLVNPTSSARLSETRRAVALKRACRRFSARCPFFAAADRQNIPNRCPVVPDNIPR